MLPTTNTPQWINFLEQEGLHVDDVRDGLGLIPFDHVCPDQIVSPPHPSHLERPFVLSLPPPSVPLVIPEPKRQLRSPVPHPLLVHLIGSKGVEPRKRQHYVTHPDRPFIVILIHLLLHIVGITQIPTTHRTPIMGHEPFV